MAVIGLIVIMGPGILLNLIYSEMLMDNAFDGPLKPVFEELCERLQRQSRSS